MNAYSISVENEIFSRYQICSHYSLSLHQIFGGRVKTIPVLSSISIDFFLLSVLSSFYLALFANLSSLLTLILTSEASFLLYSLNSLLVSGDANSDISVSVLFYFFGLVELLRLLSKEQRETEILLTKHNHPCLIQF